MMKKVFSVIVLLLCCVTIVSCGSDKAMDNKSANKSDEIMESSPVPTQQPEETMENSPVPTQQPEESKENMKPKSEEIGGIYGKWKILDMVGHGYIFGEFSMEDYVGGVVTIDKDYMETDLPMGKYRLENPEYKLTTQSENEFLEGTKVSVENIFGFKPDKIQMVEVRNGYNGYNGFVRFWIRDETHLIFHGPVYFLAEKVE